jgi:hypothetical protein
MIGLGIYGVRIDGPIDTGSCREIFTDLIHSGVVAEGFRPIPLFGNLSEFVRPDSHPA